MKLKEICLENFQGILGEAAVKVKDFTVLVGRNDVGKSTILKALNMFLNGVLPTQDSKNAGFQGTIIGVELRFEVQDSPIIIDDAVPTTFRSERLLDSAGLLRVRKEWDLSAAKPAAKTFVLRETFGENDFLLLSEKDLIKKCEKLGIETKKANGETFNNVEKRKKIEAELVKIGEATTLEWLALPTSGTARAKIIHDVIKTILPSFQYFKADTSLDESDAAIQKYFRAIAQKTLADGIMDEVEDKLRVVLQSVLSNLAEKINEVVPENDGIEPFIDFDWAKAVTTSFRTTQNQLNVPLSQRGDGFRRITMMAYFEHLAEQDVEDDQKIIFGFEEPETFLHPLAQEQLFERLEGLAGVGHQVLLTSHSPIIVARSDKEALVHAISANGVTEYRGDIEDLTDIANDLGINIDNQFLAHFNKAKVLLLVEGIDDALALEYVSKLYKVAGKIPKTFEELSIVLLPIGGCNSIEHWVRLDLLKKLTKPFFIFLDSDQSSLDQESPNKTLLINSGFDYGVNCLVSRKRSLENYILPSTLKRLIPGLEIGYSDFDQVKDICKAHSMKRELKGGKVASHHFYSQTYDEVRLAFAPNGDDEFLNLYEAVGRLLP